MSTYVTTEGSNCKLAVTMHCKMDTFFKRNLCTSTRGAEMRCVNDLTLICAIVSGDFFQTALVVLLKKDAKLSTDHHLVGCKICLEKQTGSAQACGSRRSYRIMREVQVDKVVRINFTVSVSSSYYPSSERSATSYREGEGEAPVATSAARICASKRHGALNNGE